ncbi:MAG: hypothetical protein HN559_22045 [Gemmatimonadetes bacterium]|nr:hypothetical protein [Gemmatimonadota bacterium]
MRTALPPRLCVWLIVSSLALASVSPLMARSHRVDQVPHGQTLGCATCHVNPSGGGSRNAFGTDVESFLTSVDASGDVQWSDLLATIDSDGDGFTNGQELGDWDGLWSTGDANPEQSPTAPGNAGSLPAFEGEWTDVGFVDVIDAKGFGGEGFRVVVETNIESAGGDLTLGELVEGEGIQVKGELSRDYSTVYARSIFVGGGTEPEEGVIDLIIRGLDGSDIIIGDFVRPFLTNTEFVSEASGQTQAIADFQSGELVKFTVGMYDIGHFVTRLAREPDLSDDVRETFDQDVELAFMQDADGILRTFGPTFDVTGTDFFDEFGAAIDPAAIPFEAEIVIEFTDPSSGQIPTAHRVDILAHGAEWPTDPDVLLQRFDAVHSGVEMTTFDPHLRRLARDADLVFGDGSAANRSDVVSGFVRLVVNHPPHGRLYYGDVISALTVDPPDYTGPGAPAQEPTEFFSEEIRHDFFDQVEDDMVRFGGATVVVEGDVIDGDGNSIGIGGLQIGNWVAIEATPSVDVNLFYASLIQPDPPVDYNPESGTGFWAEIRWIDGDELGVGDPWKQVWSGADYIDAATGLVLSLTDYSSGDLVEFVVAQTDVGERIVSISRNPDFDPGPDTEIRDQHVGFVDDKDRLWDIGNEFVIDPGAAVTDTNGNTIAVGSIAPQAWIAVEWSDQDQGLAVAIEVLPVDMGSSNPNVGLFHFDRVEGDRLFTFAPYPRPIAREAVIEFDDGTPASIASIPTGPVRLFVTVPGYNFPHLGDFIEHVIIDPVDFGTGGEPAPQPTEFFGEYEGIATIAFADEGKEQIGFGEQRVVIEGDIVDEDGVAISIDDLRPGETIFIEATASIDPSLFYAHHVQQDPNWEGEAQGTSFRAFLVAIDGPDLIVSEHPRPYLDDIEVFDIETGQSLTLGDLQSGDQVEFLIAQTDLGDYVAALTRVASHDLPEPRVTDIDFAFVRDGAAWLTGPVWTLAAGVTVIDENGNSIDVNSITSETQILITLDPNTDEVVHLETVPEGIYLGDEDSFQDRFDRVGADQLHTFTLTGWPIVREADITFDDGSVATLADVGPGPNRVLFAPRDALFPFIGEVIEWIIIDPLDFGSNGEPPPQPTEFFGEYSNFGVLDVIDPIKGIGLDRLRIVVGGDISDPDGNLYSLDELNDGEGLFVEGQVNATRDVFFAHTLLRNANHLPDTQTSTWGTVRGVEGDDIFIGDGVRVLLDDVEFINGSTGEILSLDDLQLGDFVEATVVQTDVGDYVSRVVVNPETEFAEEGPIHTQDVDVAWVENDVTVWTRGPDFDISTADVVGVDGAPVDAAGIDYATPLAIHVDPTVETPQLFATFVEVLEPGVYPEGENVWFQHWDGLTDDILRTLEPFPRNLAADATVIFNDDAPGTVADIHGPLRLTILGPSDRETVLRNEVIVDVLLDPVDFGEGSEGGEEGPPPQPTEYFGEWSGIASLDIIDPIKGIGFGRARVVVEGDIVDPAGNLLSLDDLQAADGVLIRGDRASDEDVIYARKIFVHPDGVEDTQDSYGGTVREVLDGEIIIGDWVRPLLDDIEIADGQTGELLSLDDLQPGAIVDYVIAHTDLGDYLAAFVVNPTDVGNLEPEFLYEDTQLAFIDGENLVWTYGPDFEIGETEFFDAAGEPIDPTTIDYAAPLAILVDPEAASDQLRATRVEVLEPGQQLADPEIWWMQNFDGYDNGVLRTLNPYPLALTRDADVIFANGEPATRDDIPGGPVRLTIKRPPVWEVILWRDVIVGVEIDPADFGTGSGDGGETSEPTEFFGEWDGVASIDYIDPEARDVGFGRIQLIVEGEIFGADGEPMTVDRLNVDDAIYVEAQPSIDPEVFYASVIHVDPDFEIITDDGTFHAFVRSVEDGSLYVGDLIRPLLSDAELYDAVTDDAFPLSDLRQGDIVEYSIAHTDVGDFVSYIGRGPDIEFPADGWDADVDLAFLDEDGFVWLAGATYELASLVDVFDLEGNRVGQSLLEAGTWIGVFNDPDNPNVATRIEMVEENVFPDEPDAQIWRFDRIEDGELYTFDAFLRPLVREVDLSFADGSQATIDDLVAGPIHLSVLHPRRDFPPIGDVIDAIVIGGIDSEPLLDIEQFLSEGEDFDDSGDVDEADYQVYLWLAGPDAEDINGDGVSGYIDFEAWLLGAGTGTDGELADSPITIDFDPEEGDQQVHLARNARPGREYELQLHLIDGPAIQGWSVTIQYDPTQLQFVSRSFGVSDFIPGGLPLVRVGAGELGVGTSILLGDSAGEGAAWVGTLRFVTLEEFSGETAIEIVRYGFRPVDGEQLFLAVSSTATISDEVTGDLAADFDGDGVVDFPDFFLFAAAFWTENETYDLNGDGFINFSDFFLFSDAFGQQLPAFKLLALAQEMIGLPKEAELNANFPNPFNASTTIPLLLPQPGHVDLEIYDVLGQRVRHLVSETLAAGVHHRVWDGRDEMGRYVAGGVYFARLVTTPHFGEGRVRVRKLMLTE